MEFLSPRGKIYYETAGEGEPILFLHGWGGSTASFEGAVRALKNSFFCINLDFFGHGKSDMPTLAYGIRAYAQSVAELIKHLNIGKVNIAAHSFGGRAAIYIAALYPELVNKLILIDSAGLRPRRGLKYRFKVLTYKIKKRLGMNVSKYGSADYRAADPRLRATFNRIVNENLKKFLRFICAETLILWGAADRDTPLWMAKKLNKKIRGSSLFVFPEGGHYSYIDYHGAFVEVCKQFFGVI